MQDNVQENWDKFITALNEGAASKDNVSELYGKFNEAMQYMNKINKSFNTDIDIQKKLHAKFDEFQSMLNDVMNRGLSSNSEM